MKLSYLGRASRETISFVVVISLILAYVVNYSAVSNDNMHDLRTNDIVLVDKLAYRFHPPQRGDIVYFLDPLGKTQYLVRRVIGLPNDTIMYNNTSVWVNNIQLKEPYISIAGNHGSSNSNSTNNTLKVPPNHYFVMRDNRPARNDSRDWGPVSSSDITGKVVVIIWPVSSWERINTYNFVYSKIK